MRVLRILPLLLLVIAPAARADEPVPEDPAVKAARTQFLQGADLVRNERWADALAAFERADKIKPHPITTYNIAQCERALGHYTRARRSLLAALKLDERAGHVLPESARNDARGLLAEIERIMPRVAVKLAPVDAALAVDGRPLERLADAAGARVFVAGTRPAGRGEAPGVASFTVLLDPGAHVFTVSRAGYQDVVVNRSFPPGTKQALSLELDRLPATIRVTSSLRDAVVHVGESDVGNPPVEVSRIAGTYHVSVAHHGYLTYETDVFARPGEHVDISAPMHPEKRSIVQQWWFWTIAGAVLTGAALTTYFLTRPDPTRPPVDGGGLGWTLRTP
jgi:hypothetical protein